MLGIVRAVGRDTHPERLGEIFLRVGKLLRAVEAQRFAPYGLTPAQGRVLGVLADSSEQMCMGELAIALGVVPRAITPQIDVLEQAGLVRRRTDPYNRRSILLDLTAHGNAVREQLRNERALAVETIFAGLTTTQRHTLLELLERVAPDRATLEGLPAVVE
jgi:DNA-binding MarR family transcriptional regulator